MQYVVKGRGQTGLLLLREGEAGRKFKGEGVMTRLSGEQCEEGMGSSIQKREG